MPKWRFWKYSASSSVSSSEFRELQDLARNHYNSKDYVQAEPYLLKLLSAKPNSPWATDVMSRLLMNTKRFDEAIILLESISNLDSDRELYLQRIAKCHYSLKQYQECEKILNELILDSKITNDGWDLLKMVLQKQYQKKYIDSFWIELSKKRTSYPQIEIELIRIELETKNFSSAAIRIEKINQIIDSIDLSEEWMLELAEILCVRAPEIAKKILAKFSNTSEEFVKIMIKTQRALGDNDGAMKTAVNALASNMSHGLLFSTVRLAWDIGDMEDVVKYSNLIISDKPNQRVANRFMLKALVKIGDLERITNSINKTLEKMPDFIEAHRVMIDIGFSELKDWDLVIRHCDYILQYEPEDRRSLCHKIHALIKIKSYDDALLLADRATEIHPNDDEIDLTFAQLCWKMKNGKHISKINRMLSRHNLANISSKAIDQNISVENLECSAPDFTVGGPLVSIIMTVYGRDKYLDVAVSSVLNQSHKNIELIIVDDRSTDDAYQYLTEYASKEPRMKVLQVNENGGTYCAKNSAISIANGEYIAFMDSDDWTHPQRIEKQLSAIIDTPYKAVCHSYFRINEVGDLFYKGIGSIRLACISLFAHRSVFEQLGHFDSMRVGADTEFIERIKAFYGDEALLHDRIPSMFMLMHSSSLTGGGKFEISWRSIAGPRLEHHSSFKEWHKKIKHGKVSPHVDFPLRVRPYYIPNEMTAGKSHWENGNPLFTQLLFLRNKKWGSRVSSPAWQYELSESKEGLLWAKEQGLTIPEIIWSGKLESMPSINLLPGKCVIVPDKRFMNSQPIYITNSTDIFDGKTWDMALCQKTFNRDGFLNNVVTDWRIERMLAPESFREDEKVPRVWKFYFFGKKLALIHSELMVGSGHQTVDHFFTPDLRQIRQQIFDSKPIPDDPLYFPHAWDKMIQQVYKLANELNCFVQIEMYATANGPVFAGITHNPNKGMGYSKWAEKYLASYWK